MQPESDGMEDVMDLGRESLIINDNGTQAILVVEEVYGKEINLFTKIDGTLGGPLVAGVATVEGNFCYLLNIAALLHAEPLLPR
jgi:hypothetical protein